MGSALKDLKSKLRSSGLYSDSKKNKKDRIVQSIQLRSKHASHQASQSNPFEHKFAPLKHDILNKKIKGVGGKPGLTRKRSQETRQKTLLVEMKNKHRDSSMVDRRFGETNPSMSVEDRMLERFMKEKSTKVRHSDHFNLEEESLTHLGQSLGDEDAFTSMGFQKVDNDSDGIFQKLNF